MADAVEKELDILMSEKEQADKQIASFLELQLKVHTVIFTAAAIAAGWVFAQEKDGLLGDVEVRGAAALTLAFLGCFTVLQGAINYGVVLGYIRYKHLVVGRRMQELLALPKNPLTAMTTISTSFANRVVVLASFFGGCFVLLGSAWLLGYVVCKSGETTSSLLFPWGFLAGTILWLGAVTCGIGLGISMRNLIREMNNEVPIAGVPAVVRDQAVGGSRD